MVSVCLWRRCLQCLPGTLKIVLDAGVDPSPGSCGRRKESTGQEQAKERHSPGKRHDGHGAMMVDPDINRAGCKV